MRAAVLEDKMKWVIREVLDPVLDKDEVLVKVKYCGICGSDLHTYREGAAVGSGHEFSGDVVEVGPDVKEWKVGDRVAIEPCISCGECDWCKRGEIGLCEQYYVALLQFKGAFSTYAKAKHNRLHKLPDSLSYESATLIEPTTCALHAVNLFGMKKGDVVAVLGLGPIGQLVARVARASGAKAVYASEISQSRIELARNSMDEVIDTAVSNPVDRILELTHGKGVDVVFECAGSVMTTQQSIFVVKTGGTIIIAGICFEPVELPISQINLRGLTVKGSFCFSEGEFASAFNLIRDGKIDVAPLVTCKMPLDDINEAFGKAMRSEGGKILIEP
jgi:(R,R)-butanediol dehydrogenase/meso-butanediol dehydrogenase/diacetyl reductase